MCTGLRGDVRKSEVLQMSVISSQDVGTIRFQIWRQLCLLFPVEWMLFGKCIPFAVPWPFENMLFFHSRRIARVEDQLRSSVRGWAAHTLWLVVKQWVFEHLLIWGLQGILEWVQQVVQKPHRTGSSLSPMWVSWTPFYSHPLGNLLTVQIRMSLMQGNFKIWSPTPVNTPKQVPLRMPMQDPCFPPFYLLLSVMKLRL